MKIKNPKITILVNEDVTRIELYDGDAGITFARIELTPKQLSQALSRLAHTECKSCEVFGMKNLGKKLITKPLEFPLPPKFSFQKRKQIAEIEALKYIPNGWSSDLYLNSKGSFFRKDGQEWARITIRKWVEDESNDTN